MISLADQIERAALAASQDTFQRLVALRWSRRDAAAQARAAHADARRTAILELVPEEALVEIILPSGEARHGLSIEVNSYSLTLEYADGDSEVFHFVNVANIEEIDA